MPAPVGISAYIGDASNPGLVDATGRDARFDNIFSLTTDPAGNTYVIDQKSRAGGPVIRRITPEGVVTTLPKSSCYTNPRDLAVGGDGHLYILDAQQDGARICRQTPAGEITLFFAQAGQPNSDLSFTTLARGPGNDLFAASRRVICRLTPDGKATVIAGAETSIVQDPFGSDPADGTGAAARFGRISGITADAAGNVYVGEALYGVRKVTPQGVVTTLARIPDLPGAYFLPIDTFVDTHLGIVLQADGSLIVPKWANATTGSAFLRVAPGGQVSTVPGSENLVVPFTTPSLAADAKGNIIYSGASGVGRLLPDGKHTQLAGRGLEGLDQATQDVPAAVDTAGNLYTYGRLTGGRSLTLRKRNPQGELIPYGPGRDILSLMPPDGSVVDTSIAIASDGTAYASCMKQGPGPGEQPASFNETEIHRISPSGETTRLLFARKGEANFAAPTAITPGPDGTLYFIDSQRLAVRKLNKDGSVVAVTQDGEVSYTNRFGVSPAGKVYVFGGVSGRRVFTVTAAGRLEPLAGREDQGAAAVDSPVVDGAGTAASFYFPSAPVFDEQGNLYVLDNATLRRITPAGVVTTLAGVPGRYDLQLGALPGSLKYSSHLARGADGVFYVRSGDAIVRIRMPAP